MSQIFGIIGINKTTNEYIHHQVSKIFTEFYEIIIEISGPNESLGLLR
jgi:hypothetical protein